MVVAVFSISPSDAQRYRRNGNQPIPDKPELGSLGAQINANTIAIVSGNINAAWLTIAYDLSAVLDDGNDFRVLPVIGKGGAQNVRDVRYLKGIDLGMTVGPVLTRFRQSGELGNIDDKIVYITKLFNQEMHVLVRADSGITSLEQFRGKKVNFSDAGSATQLSARDIFKRLNIQVEEVNTGQGDALVKMRNGEIAGTFLSNAKPAPVIAKLRPSDGFRLLPVPYSKQLHQDLFPATITHQDYPGVIPQGQSIETVAYGSMIIAYNWPKGSERHRRIALFVDRFFSNFAEFKKRPRHPKWREVNLAAEVPGWKRFDAAEEWLKNHRETQQHATAERTRFDRFLASGRGTSGTVNALSPADRERLFQDFLKWRGK
ncbi:MAG: TAXI family TRAP transporter solute-binding subunit [Xanthobacteraceae bacterium]